MGFGLALVFSLKIGSLYNSVIQGEYSTTTKNCLQVTEIQDKKKRGGQNLFFFKSLMRTSLTLFLLVDLSF